MKAEKKYVNKVVKRNNEILKEGNSLVSLIVPSIREIACNVEECYFENYGACLAQRVIITNEGCITDRNLIEE